MLHSLTKALKKLIPRSIKEKIKSLAGLGMTSHGVKTFARVDTDPTKVNIAVYTGGGLGDFIINSALIDQMLLLCDCRICLFTLSYDNAVKILGNRPNVEVYYPFRIPRKKFDVFFEFDHFLHVREFNPIKLRRKSREMYEAVCKVVEHNNENVPSYETPEMQRLYLITRAKYLGLNRWTMLSGGGVFDMSSMRADIFMSENSDALKQCGLEDTKYVTIHYGTDPDLGGARQTKLWSYENFCEFVTLFKAAYPHYKVVQLAANKESEIPGADISIRDAGLDKVKTVLGSAEAHVSSEGGIAHLATQTGTKCVVLFGPTPVHYYGYPTNINIVSPFCSGCMGMTLDWNIRCLRGLVKPECMSGITAESVLAAVGAILNRNE